MPRVAVEYELSLDTGMPLGDWMNEIENINAEIVLFFSYINTYFGSVLDCEGYCEFHTWWE